MKNHGSKIKQKLQEAYNTKQGGTLINELLVKN
jgi:hypothetical protein